MFISQNDTLVKTTTHKAVLPFYVYASLSLLAATIMLFFSSGAFTLHHFHPHTLAITHAMALGWGTMIILGASHQLVPVLIEGSLYSYKLAYACFVFAAMGIPLLVFGFYTFQLGFATLLGAVLINVAIVAFLVNMVLSMLRSKHESVHAVFVLTAVLWLLLTTLVGLALTINFTTAFLPKASLHYLSLHAHMGIVGWLLLLVIG
ncbi:MAG: cytochrome C oxidase subunit I, partial [Chitinophagaceae bacterium]